MMICIKCGHEMKLWLFAKGKHKGEPHTSCRKCQRRANLKKNYGIDYGKYITMLRKQKHRCAICKAHQRDCPRPGRKNNIGLVVDHDHLTGKVRGLICHRCNTILGYCQERIETLRAAIRYLKLYSG